MNLDYLIKQEADRRVRNGVILIEALLGSCEFDSKKVDILTNCPGGQLVVHKLYSMFSDKAVKRILQLCGLDVGLFVLNEDGTIDRKSWFAKDSTQRNIVISCNELTLAWRRLYA